MQANDAMKILGSAAAMGLLGGGGALAYNAVSQPTLDEYGNTIESNDINPFVAALGGAAIGAVGGGIYGHYNQPVAKPMQGMSAGASPQPRQSPDIDIEVLIPNPQAEESARTRAMERTRYAQGVNDLREASTPIRQIVRANPMKPQNPMSPPGADIVVVPQNPVQQSADELMALQNLALRQSQGTQYFDNSLYGRTFVNASANPIDNYSKREAQLPAIRQVAEDHNQWMAQNQGQQNAAGWDVVNPSRQQQERLEYEALMAQKKRA